MASANRTFARHRTNTVCRSLRDFGLLMPSTQPGTLLGLGYCQKKTLTLFTSRNGDKCARVFFDRLYHQSPVRPNTHCVPIRLKAAEHRRTPQRKRIGVPNDGHVLECGSVLPLLGSSRHNASLCPFIKCNPRFRDRIDRIRIRRDATNSAK